MSQVVSYWDDALNKYVEVSTNDPLPTTAVGGGAGGSEQVAITSANGDALTAPADTDGLGATGVGLVTNARLYGYNGTTWDRLRTINGNADALATDVAGVKVAGFNHMYNGVTWDRVRNNTEGTLFPSAARTSTQSTPTQTNYNSKGVILYLNVTANPGGSETLSINFHYVDPVSNNVTTQIATLITQPAVNGMYTLHLYPGASSAPTDPANNKSFSLPLPRQWQAAIAHSGSGSWTYSLGYSLIS
jgi:hypothetical protein